MTKSDLICVWGAWKAASLQVKLKHLPGWNSKRREIAKKYQAAIRNTKIKMQLQPVGHDSIFHLFVITTEDRDELIKFLNERNIFPGLHYPVPCHLQKAYTGLGYKKGDLPNAEYLAEHCLSLPMYAELSQDDVEYVIKTLNSY